MAKPATKAVTPAGKKKPGTAIADVKAIDAQLAARAQAMATNLSNDGVARIKVDSKRGVFVTSDGLELGSSFRAVVVDFVLANRFYHGIYDPNNIQPPDCMAVARVEDLSTMAPFENAPDKQNDLCKTCPQNQWGTAQRGNGKACKNQRDIALIIIDDTGATDDKLYFVTVPPTGIQAFDGIAKYIGRTYNSTPLRCIMTIEVEDRGEYSTWTFKDPEPNPDYASHAALLSEAAEQLEHEPDFTKREQQKTKPGARKPAAKTPARVPQRGAR